MARIRSLKIGFFRNADLGKLSPWHRLLYEGLWLLADREGRLEDSPLLIRCDLFPYDAIDVDALLTDLATAGFLWRYERDGKRYIAMPTFLKHQRPHHKEPPSIIPPPVERRSRKRQEQVKHDSSLAQASPDRPGSDLEDDVTDPLGSGSLSLGSGSGNGIRDLGSGDDQDHRAESARPSHSQLARIAKDVIRSSPPMTALSDLCDDVKILAARAGLAYDTNSVTKAVSAVMFVEQLQANGVK